MQICKIYLSDSLRAPIFHHLTPTGHRCNSENHTHQNPRNQTHFPEIQTQPKLNFQQNQNPCEHKHEINNKIAVKRNQELTSE